MFDSQTTGYRLINGESDGWPGLVLDRYDNTLVLKLYTLAWLPRLEEIADLLATESRLVLRLSRNIQTKAGEQFALADGQILRWGSGSSAGRVSGEMVAIQRMFCADRKPFFLDHTENRRQTGALWRRVGAVLNLFSYTGWFSRWARRCWRSSVRPQS